MVFFGTYCLFDVLVAVAVAVVFVIKLCKVLKCQKNLYSADSFLYRICATACHENQSCSVKRASLVSPSDKSLHGLYLEEIFQTWSVGHAPRN